MIANTVHSIFVYIHIADNQQNVVISPKHHLLFVVVFSKTPKAWHVTDYFQWLSQLSETLLVSTPVTYRNFQFLFDSVCCQAKTAIKKSG